MFTSRHEPYFCILHIPSVSECCSYWWNHIPVRLQHPNKTQRHWNPLVLWSTLHSRWLIIPAGPGWGVCRSESVCQPWVWRDRNIFRHAVLGCIFMPCPMTASIPSQTHTTTHHSTSPKTPFLPARDEWNDKLNMFLLWQSVGLLYCVELSRWCSKQEAKKQKVWHPESETDSSHKHNAESSKAI